MITVRTTKDILFLYDAVDWYLTKPDSDKTKAETIEVFLQYLENIKTDFLDELGGF